MNNNFSKIALSLFEWYNLQSYEMPWRNSKDPYKIWISEIMLQQTQVNTAKPYYLAWMKSFPTVKSVACADIDNILKVWEGLGYYKRAHNLYESSKIILNQFNGNIPDNYKDLLSLKGVGDYTASAILSIAYNKPYPVFDGNIKRIISRLYKLKNKNDILVKSKKTISQCMKYIDSGDINQSFMDFGREICTPQNPKCDICPISLQCKSYHSKQVNLYPPKEKKPKKPTYDVAVGLIWKNSKILISKRNKNKLLGGLWELPGGKKNRKENLRECLKRELLEEIDIEIKIDEKIGKIKHSYSHFGIHMTGYICNYKKGIAKALASEEIRWINFNEISNFAFPRATIKLFELYEKNYQ
tara:strand:- start:151 stop:1218 length:1068 start_codon:yes stop_codon:yes gene_type:complete